MGKDMKARGFRFIEQISKIYDDLVLLTNAISIEITNTIHEESLWLQVDI